MQAIRMIRSIPGVVSGAAIVLALWFMAPSASADSVMKGIKPGPTEQSAAEKSIEADPANGIEHAVILIEEYERDESPGTNGKTHYHLRAKILSNEGRDLADVVIPGLDRSSKIVDWWGRTIQPDGTVQELAQDELESQLAASSRGGGDIEDVKAALPGVVAGSVIDYGYTVRGAGFYSYDRVPLQRRYSTREFRYAWRPFKGQQGAYFLSRTENLNVKHEVDGRDIVVQGRNLPAARDEMLMPPRDAARAMLYLYYVPFGTQFKTYWEDLARGMTSLIDSTYKKASARKAIEQIRLAPEGSLDDKLRALYTWVGENIVREGLQSFEERREEDDEDEKQRRDNVRQLMEVRSGSIFDVHTFFIALARALGAEANLVYAADRTQNYWNPQMRTFRQFGSTLVAVGPKGAKPEQMTVLDPGSGMNYGVVPWWYAGVSAMMVDEKEMRPILVPQQDIKGSQVVSTATIRFEDDNELLLVDWARESTGQDGMSALRTMRRLAPSDRKRRIEDNCSLGEDSDVLEASAEGIEEVSDRYKLQCEVEEITDITETLTSYQYGIAGPWIQWIPDLPDEERQYPIVMHYPRYEQSELEIHAPEGFVPDTTPDPVDLKTDFGRYLLTFEKIEDGFKVTRRLALVQTGVPKEYYESLRAFFEDIRKHDRSRVVFKRER